MKLSWLFARLNPLILILDFHIYTNVFHIPNFLSFRTDEWIFNHYLLWFPDTFSTSTLHCNLEDRQVRRYEREFLRNIRNWQRLDFLFLLLLLDYVFWKKKKAAKKISYVKLLVSPWTTEIRHSDKVWEKRMRYKVGIFIMVWRAHGFSEVCK